MMNICQQRRFPRLAETRASPVVSSRAKRGDTDGGIHLTHCHKDVKQLRRAMAKLPRPEENSICIQKKRKIQVLVHDHREVVRSKFQSRRIEGEHERIAAHPSRYRFQANELRRFPSYRVDERVIVAHTRQSLRRRNQWSELPKHS